MAEEAKTTPEAEVKKTEPVNPEAGAEVKKEDKPEAKKEETIGEALSEKKA